MLRGSIKRPMDSRLRGNDELFGFLQTSSEALTKGVVNYKSTHYLVGWISAAHPPYGLRE
jgi:hypothetical protein